MRITDACTPYIRTRARLMVRVACIISYNKFFARGFARRWTLARDRETTACASTTVRWFDNPQHLPISFWRERNCSFLTVSFEENFADFARSLRWGDTAAIGERSTFKASSTRRFARTGNYVKTTMNGMVSIIYWPTYHTVTFPPTKWIRYAINAWKMTCVWNEIDSN